jgi:hypothetical protein
VTSQSATPRASGTPTQTFHIGDTVRWCWTGDNATGQWFTARLTGYRPPEFPAGWAGELVDPGTFYGTPDHYWHLDPGETVYLDEPSMVVIDSEPDTDNPECE